MIAALVVAAAVPLVAAPTAGALPLLGQEGRWLTDPQGRVVILHGAQIDKFQFTPPPVSWRNIVDISPANVRFIAEQGFNAARVSISYAGVEPAPGKFDEAYIGSYLALDRELASAGVWDMLDLQQGQYSNVLNGNGFPDWMTVTSGLPNNREPYSRGYLDNPAEMAAWDNFWANAQPSVGGAGIQDRYISGLRLVAERFATAPALLGIDIMNEPWPGSRWPLCASPVGCLRGGFDQTALTDFYRRVIPALRSADPRHLIVYEPNLLFDFGAATTVGDVADTNALFAFHSYCLGRAPGLSYVPDPVEACQVNEEVVFGNAEAHSARSGHALLMSEWGNDTDVVLDERMAREADRHMIGWNFWAYEDCCNSPAAIVKDGTKPPTAAGNLNRRVLGALVRAYPQAIAGTPAGWSYDPGSKRFELNYSTARVGGGGFDDRAVTEIEVPPLHYPTGFDTSLDGATVVSAPDADPLLVEASPGASTVRVAVTPATHHPQPAGIPSKCIDPPERVRISRRRHARITRANVYVNGRRTTTLRGRRARRPRLPRGLTNGSTVRIVAVTSRRGRLVALGRIEDCRFKRG